MPSGSTSKDSDDRLLVYRLHLPAVLTQVLSSLVSSELPSGSIHEFGSCTTCCYCKLSSYLLDNCVFALLYYRAKKNLFNETRLDYTKRSYKQTIGPRYLLVAHNLWVSAICKMRFAISKLRSAFCKLRRLTIGGQHLLPSPDTSKQSYKTSITQLLQP